MSFSEIKYALNSTLGTSGFLPLNKILKGGSQIFTANGMFTVPEGVNSIYVTACAAGGNGGQGVGMNNYASQNYGYGGGGGGAAGDCVIDKLFKVTAGQNISITVGTGNTVIGSLVTLLKGNNGANGSASAGNGRGGNGGDNSHAQGGTGQALSGNITDTGKGNARVNGGGGAGITSNGRGFTQQLVNGDIVSYVNLGGQGGDSPLYAGAPGGIGYRGGGSNPWEQGAGGGGGASLYSRGGAGGNRDFAGNNATGYGAGGGGSGAVYNSATPLAGGIGSKGIVIIEW